MSSNGTNWGSIAGSAAEGALSAWLDSPNDQSVSASDAAATQGGNSKPEQDAIPQGNGDANTGNTGWSLPQGNNLMLIGGLALAGVIAFTVVAAD